MSIWVENMVDSMVKHVRTLDFTFTKEDTTEFDPNVKVFRYKEGGDRKFPYVTLEAIVTSRDKNRSIANVITNAGSIETYHEYGFAKVVQFSLHIYTSDVHDERKVNGRHLASHIVDILWRDILKNWDDVLDEYNTVIDVDEDIGGFNDLTFYDRKSGHYIHNYDVNVMTLMNFRWNDIPPTGKEDEPICKTIYLGTRDVDEDSYENYDKISIDD